MNSIYFPAIFLLILLEISSSHGQNENWANLFRETVERHDNYRKGDQCTPEMIFFDRCNICLCSRNGRDTQSCTTNDCLRPPSDISQKIFNMPISDQQVNGAFEAIEVIRGFWSGIDGAGRILLDPIWKALGMRRS